jgi:hypothetical protein
MDHDARLFLSSLSPDWEDAVLIRAQLQFRKIHLSVFILPHKRTYITTQRESTFMMIDSKIISEILQTKTRYANDEEEDACRVCVKKG